MIISFGHWVDLVIDNYRYYFVDKLKEIGVLLSVWLQLMLGNLTIIAVPRG